MIDDEMYEKSYSSVKYKSEETEDFRITVEVH